MAGLATPTGAPAQAVRGTVADADYHRPVSGATVLLVDSLSANVDATTTDEAGRFHLAAPAPGRFVIHVALEGYLSYSSDIALTRGETAAVAIAMPVISTRAARAMQEVIDREAAFQLPWEELCGEPVRPWEAGVLVGVSRDRATLDPVPRAVVVLEPLEGPEPGRDSAAASTGAAWPRTRLATATGAFWFCNIPPGRARIVARAEGFRGDTSHATIRTGTISWYDALLRRR